MENKGDKEMRNILKNRNPQETKEILTRAYQIGWDTFKNGGSVIPAQSKPLMDLMGEYKIQIGEGIPIMASFQAGFVNCPVELLNI